MTDFDINAQDRFPNGTDVEAYPVSNWVNGIVDQGAAPVGTVAATETMTAGTLTFTGLDDEPHVAYAEVADQHRYVFFIVGEDVSDTGLVTQAQLAAVAAAEQDASTAATDTELAANAAAHSVITGNNQTANYTLVLTDAGKCVEMNNAAARTITVPPNVDVAFATDTVIEVFRQGAGTVTLVAGAGVTIRSPGGLLALAAQYSTASLRKRGTNEWVLSGDLA